MQNTMTADRYAIETCQLYKDAHKFVSTYESRKKAYRDELMSMYFDKCEILVCNQGLVLATAKLQERSSFRTEDFKRDYPELYAEYSTTIITQPLVVK